MSTTRSAALREARVDDHAHKARRALQLAPLGFLCPFVHPGLGVMAGGALAAVSLWHHWQARQIPIAHKPEPNFQAEAPGDTDFTPDMCLGYVMDFEDYKNYQEQWASDHGIARVTTEHLTRYNNDMLPFFSPFMMKNDLMTRHVAVGGATGVGKTELIMSAIQQRIAYGGGALILNAKGDRQFRNNVCYLASLYGRYDDVRIIDFEDPNISHSYNPVLNGKNVRIRVSTLMKLTAKSTEEFFRDQSRSALVAMMACLEGQPGRTAYHLGDLGVLANNPKEFHRLFVNMDESDSELKDFVWQFLSKWVDRDRDGKPYYKDKFHEILNGLATKMFDLAHTEYRDLLCTYDPEVDIKYAIQNNQIVIASVPALADKEAVELFGQLLMADLSRSTGEIQNEGSHPLVPFMVLLEEYPSFRNENDQELFQLARAANISLWVTFQGLGFLADRNNPSFADNLLSNCWTQIYLYSLSSETYEYVQKLAGTVVRQFQQNTSGVSFGGAASAAETGVYQTESDTVSESQGIKEMREELIQPEDFRLMDKGDALIISRQDVFRARLPIVEFDEVPADIEWITKPYYRRKPRRGLNLMEASRRNDQHIIERLSKWAGAS